jgi:hypothetical protein
MANQVRLLLHGAVSCLLDTPRRWLVRAGGESALNLVRQNVMHMRA